MWLVANTLWSEYQIGTYETEAEAKAEYDKLVAESIKDQLEDMNDPDPICMAHKILLTEVKQIAIIKHDTKEETKYNEGN